MMRYPHIFEAHFPFFKNGEKNNCLVKLRELNEYLPECLTRNEPFIESTILNLIASAFVNISFTSLRNNVFLGITSKQLWSLWIDTKDTHVLMLYVCNLESSQAKSPKYLDLRESCKTRYDSNLLWIVTWPVLYGFRGTIHGFKCFLL